MDCHEVEGLLAPTWMVNWSRLSRRPCGLTWTHAPPVASDWRTWNQSAEWFVVRPTTRHRMRLRARLTQSRTRSTTTSQLLAWAAAVVMVASLSGSILFVRSSTRAARTVDPVDAVAQEVVSSHVRAMMGEHLFDVRSTDQHTVKPWFLGKLDFSPPVTDLAQAGFPLTGGRLDYVAGRPVAALVYTRGQHTINVFVWPEASDAVRSPDARAIRGFHVRHWTHGGMSYWAVSDVNDADLDQFVHALQQ